nr:hypothetical protein [Coxiella endosymbiont of Amblyomma nuttalli]
MLSFDSVLSQEEEKIIIGVVIGEIMKKILTVAIMSCFIVGLTACQQSNKIEKENSVMSNAHHQKYPGASFNQMQKKDQRKTKISNH